MTRSGWLPARRPALTLAGAVIVRFLGLIVEQDDACREWQVDACLPESAFDRCDDPPVREHHVAAS